MGAVSKCHLLAALFVILRRRRRISRKLEIEGTLSSIFPLKHRVTIVGFVPWRSLSMTFKWSSLSILSWNQSILNWRYRKEWIFMIFFVCNIWNISNMNWKCETRANTPYNICKQSAFHCVTISPSLNN